MKRRSQSWMSHIFVQECEQTSKYSWKDVEFVNIQKAERIIILARDVIRGQEICRQMQNLPAFKGKKTECRVLSTIAHTRKVVGCNQHGFHIGVSKNTNRLWFNHCGGGYIFQDGTLHSMSKDQWRNSHCESIFQRSHSTSWLTKKHSFGSRHQVHRALLEDLMEEAGD